MQTLLTNLPIWIAPAYLAWLFLPNSFLNRPGEKSSRAAEGIAWTAFAAAVAALSSFLVLGMKTISLGVGSEQLFGARLDLLSMPLLVLVTFLLAVILRFSRNYLGSDPRQGEFIKGICVTGGSVIALILAPGLLQFALAWVATSLSLHKLLVFFPDRPGTLFSARKKFLISRIADVALILAFGLLYSSYGTQNFSSLFAQIASEPAALTGVAWLLALCAVLKSAQFPFHTWLPDTMGTPTPVSALMHAGIINGGGILLIRFSPLFQEVSSALYMVAAFGAVTAVFGSFVMLAQSSVKRSLAYSTIAQMGFMLMQCGLGAFHLALLHIIAHSLYKAHSFLSSGSAVKGIDALATRSPASQPSQGSLVAAVAVSGALAVAAFALSGISPSEKPGMLALGVVVAMAGAQLILRQFSSGITASSVTNAALAAVAVMAAYIGLSLAAAAWLAPQPIPGQVTFEVVLALFLFVALTATLQLQTGKAGLIPPSLQAKLYVHALNGFYANTLANRLLKLVKLQPKSI